MQLGQAHAALLKLNIPIFRTRDAAVHLSISHNHASKLLTRLRGQGFLVGLSKGLWTFATLKDVFLLPEYLTAPHPSYISLQSALHYHGLIEQIPKVIYAVSLSRTKFYATPLGDFSIHHLHPSFFFGFESLGKHNIKIATPEKALLDHFYLSSNRSRLFSKTPELELPKTFSLTRCRKMAARIGDPAKRTTVLRALAALRP